MISFICYLGLAFLAGPTETQAAAVNDKNQTQDREAILAMAGTYYVEFHFEETVGFPKGYEITKPYNAHALEVVIIDEETEDRIVLQHILQTKRGIIKHWRQDWLYENRELWEFQGNRTWKKRILSEEEAKGTWTQRVFQVDDSPRYESFGKWQHQNGISQWESAATSRPLPRREYSKRDDYDIMVAHNRHALTATGWVHEQDNSKLRLRDGEAQILARETGLNTYNHVEQVKCADARQWWRDHRPFWVAVRSKWDHIFNQQTELALAGEVDEKPLHRHLFDLDTAWAKNAINSEKPLGDQIDQIITMFQINDLSSQSPKTAASTPPSK